MRRWYHSRTDIWSVQQRVDDNILATCSDNICCDFVYFFFFFSFWLIFAIYGSIRKFSDSYWVRKRVAACVIVWVCVDRSPIEFTFIIYYSINVRHSQFALDGTENCFFCNTIIMQWNLNNWRQRSRMISLNTFFVHTTDFIDERYASHQSENQHWWM